MYRYYNQWPEDDLKYKFQGHQFVKQTFSQAYQDIFVLSVLNGMRSGFYLEIGCNIPDYTNNTMLLSKDFEWTGISVDILSDLAPAWQQMRPKDLFMSADAFSIDYDLILSKASVIEYLQLDIDPAPYTLALLKKLPLHNHRFKVITFETDIYTGGASRTVRNESRQILKDLGYTLIVGDVLVDRCHPYEDWWVDLDLVDRGTALSIQNHSKDSQDPKTLLFDCFNNV